MEERWQEDNLTVFNLKESDVYLLKFAFHSNKKVVLNANKKIFLQKYIELFAGWVVFVITESGRIQTLCFVLSYQKPEALLSTCFREKKLPKPQCNGKIIESWNHRVTESYNGLEGTFKIR